MFSDVVGSGDVYQTYSNNEQAYTDNSQSYYFNPENDGKSFLGLVLLAGITKNNPRFSKTLDLG